ncbi:hypothetical protein IC582_029033 [Cucumis melo]
MIFVRRESFSLWNRQSHLQRRAAFVVFTLVILKPLLHLGDVTMDQQTSLYVGRLERDAWINVSFSPLDIYEYFQPLSFF